MTIPLLQTKLTIPPFRPGGVSRPHLLERLDAGLQRKLTLVSAPAGFGKTTVLAEWAHRLQQQTPQAERTGKVADSLSFPAPAGPAAVAWVTLDPGDNDPIRFWSHLIAALQTMHPTVGQSALGALRSTQPPPIETALANLLNELLTAATQGHPQACVLILDDYHWIEAQSIHDAVTFLLDHLPPPLHLVIAGRSDPPLLLARLRGRGELTELRASHLRFTHEEAEAFLNQVMGLDLTPGEVTVLDTRTEGWIVGLQLAALSLRGQEGAQIARLIDSLGGTHRYILDYLTEEVLQRQPQEVQRFVLQTSVLDHLSGPLCDAVLLPAPAAAGHGQEMLEGLEQNNLFLVALDGERQWYRYHRLFADLLQNQLELTWPDLVPLLHRRASEWYEQHDGIPEAAAHALVAKDVARVAHLVERNALAMVQRGELATLTAWLDALPAEAVRTYPWLGVARAWVLIYAAQARSLDSLLQQIEEVLQVHSGDLLSAGDAQGPPLDREEIRHLAGHVTVIRAYRVAFDGHFSRAAELARQALEQLPPNDRLTRGFAAGLLSAMLRRTGDLAGATRAISEAVALSRTGVSDHITVVTLCNLAILQGLQGRLHEEAAICQELLRSADTPAGHGRKWLPALSLPHTILGSLYLEWNDLDAALRHSREGLERCREWGMTDMLLGAYDDMAWALQESGDPAGALEMIQQSIGLARATSPYAAAVSEAVEARLHLAQGNTASAREWANRCGLGYDDDFDFQQGQTYLLLARILLAEGREHPRGQQLTQAQELLARLLELFDRAGAVRSAIQVLVLQATAWQAQGKTARALPALERALSLAEPEGYVRTFLSEGPPMAALLKQAAARGIGGGYAQALLAACPPTEEPSPGHPRAPAAAPPTAQPLVEPLTPRELEVLALLASGLSNKAIAGELVITVGTVKNHLKNIYGKLAVNSRTAAVARARELELLQQGPA